MPRSKPPILVRCGGLARIRKALLAERGCAGGPDGSLWCDAASVEKVLGQQGCDTGCLCALAGTTHVELRVSGNQTMATHFNGNDIIAIGGGSCQGGHCKGGNTMKTGTKVTTAGGRRWADEENDKDARDDEMKRKNRGVDDDTDDDENDEDDEEFDFGFDDLDDDDEADPTATPDIESIDAATADASPSQQTATLIGQLALSVGRLMDAMRQPVAAKCWGGWQYGHAKERAFYQALVRRLESAPHARVALAFARRLVGF